MVFCSNSKFSFITLSILSLISCSNIVGFLIGRSSGSSASSRYLKGFGYSGLLLSWGSRGAVVAAGAPTLKSSYLSKLLRSLFSKSWAIYYLGTLEAAARLYLEALLSSRKSSGFGGSVVWRVWTTCLTTAGGASWSKPSMLSGCFFCAAGACVRYLSNKPFCSSRFYCLIYSSC